MTDITNIFDKDLQSTDLKKFEVEIRDWIVENATIIIEWYTDYTTSTTILEESEQEQFLKVEEKIEDLKRELMNLIYEETIDKIPYLFHRIIMIVVRLLRDPHIRDSMIFNAITEIYISVLLDLKREFPDMYSSLDVYQQFLPDSFYFIGDELSKDNNLVEIIDEEYWKDQIFKEIATQEGNKLLKHSIRSLILYCNAIKNRKIRLSDLKK